MQHFNPEEIVREILFNLKERDKEILTKRYGLQGMEIKTLAAIGSEQNLTRERVRQIEKDLIKNLRKQGLSKEAFISTRDLLINTINEHGKVISEDKLLEFFGIHEEKDRNAIIFLLHLIDEMENFLHANYKNCWSTILFNRQLLQDFSGYGKSLLENKGKPVHEQEFLEAFKETDFYRTNQLELTDKVILNFLDLAHEIEKNSFNFWGLMSWKEIKPKDVGDKAYLVLKHHGKPEHYSVITEMINKSKFDTRTAYKETVHNELIKDSRFILIGRGIYALSEWGYKAGVVSEVISEVLKDGGKPMSREEIINEVLKRRVVKKNTILVGLSNKKMFRKVSKNLYALAVVA